MSNATDRSERREEIKLRLEYAKLIVSLVGVVAIAFAGLQWKLSNRNATEAAYEHIASEWNSHLSALVERSELRPYFAESKPLPVDPKERQAVLAMADVRLDKMDAILTFAAIQEASSDIAGWRQTFADSFRSSAVLCDRFSATQTQYGLLVPVGQSACRGAKGTTR
ncbi:hypothetical protein J2X19_000132 [Rhodoferax ferrireducens]|uniref:Chemotaxis methyl-accepting receptor HlyB-like 4HB MCP domain-containing protein n=1 Tax=Rhodoferax ferrireducens TaxID=192843 RepID=A0ABU2C2C1_9BURK|nr:hypothetical protein [Rhodoferax ferrireducens]MDR7375474.1 hypothetical protein [Rhodoferax ferrireducens]